MQKFLYLLSLTLLLLPVAAAGTEASPPTALVAELSAQGCPARAAAVTKIKRDVALGLVAFNSPYVFGGAPLHDGITCSACHGSNGLSGPALRVKFEHTVPDLHARSWQGGVGRASSSPDLESFIRAAIISEFSGVDPDPVILAALGQYVRQLPDRKAPCARAPLKADAIALVASLLLAGPGADFNASQREFIASSGRFALGQIFAGAPSQLPFTPSELLTASQNFRPIDDIASQHAAAHSAEAARAMAQDWNQNRVSHGLPYLELTPLEPTRHAEGAL